MMKRGPLNLDCGHLRVRAAVLVWEEASLRLESLRLRPDLVSFPLSKVQVPPSNPPPTPNPGSLHLIIRPSQKSHVNSTSN